MPGWTKDKLESRLLGEISTTADMQMTPGLWQKLEEELKSLLVKVKEESELMKILGVMLFIRKQMFLEIITGIYVHQSK